MYSSLADEIEMRLPSVVYVLSMGFLFEALQGPMVLISLERPGGSFLLRA